MATLQRNRSEYGWSIEGGQYINVLKFDSEGRAELVSQIKSKDSSKQIQDKKEEQLEEELPSAEAKDMANVYG